MYFSALGSRFLTISKTKPYFENYVYEATEFVILNDRAASIIRLNLNEKIVTINFTFLILESSV